MEFATRTIHAEQPSEPGTGALVAPIFQTSTYRAGSARRQSGLRLLAHEQPDARPARGRARRSRGRAARGGVRLGTGRGARRAPGLAQARRRDRRPGRRLRRHLPAADEGLSSRSGASSARSTSPTPRRSRTALSDRTALVWIEIADQPAPAGVRHRRHRRRRTRARRVAGRRQHVRHAAFSAAFRARRRHRRAQRDEVPGRSFRPHPGSGPRRDASVFEPIKFLQNATGAVPSPFDCWLTLRGLKTLELRVLRHAENAAAIADALMDIRASGASTIPAWPSHPGHEIARKQMTGFGGMVSFELDGSIDDVVSFVSSRRFFALGESLGGVKSLICHPARMTHASIPADERAKLGLVGHARAPLARVRAP